MDSKKKDFHTLQGWQFLLTHVSMRVQWMEMFDNGHWAMAIVFVIPQLPLEMF